ncbi:MAG: YaaA family protein [Cryomorphaceae bacterium]|nr:YaaA family protein [Cryomorphaceae bacterium]
MDYVAIISPAKSLNDSVEERAKSMPFFMLKARRVNEVLSQFSPNDLMNLQSISQNLAELNADRNINWSPEKHQEGTPALFTFDGDVYKGIDAATLSDKAKKQSENALLILSGLYGVLHAYDAILPYRLEMGTKLPIGRAKDLYHFWRRDISEHTSKFVDNRTLINLASSEYSKALNRKALIRPVMDVEFKDFSKGSYRVIGVYAKKARGYFTRFLLEEQPKSIRELQQFDVDGYSWSSEASTDSKMVFLRGK